MSAAELIDVVKIYGKGEGKQVAVDHVSFTIEKGEFVVILGQSGAGKSTVLNMLGGMDIPTEGKVIVDGKEISSYNDKQLSEYRAETIRNAKGSRLQKQCDTQTAFNTESLAVHDRCDMRTSAGTCAAAGYDGLKRRCHRLALLYRSINIYHCSNICHDSIRACQLPVLTQNQEDRHG